MRVRGLIALGLGAAALAACSRAGPGHDKAWFAIHAGERASEIAACQADPGRLSATADCVNAEAADADAHASKFYDVRKPASRVAGPGGL
jgi:hypothetical protein